MKTIVAFLLAGTSAYALSFALDLLIGGLLGVYPATAFLPVVTWSVIASATGLVSLKLAPATRFLVIPSAVFAALALFGGIVGHHYSLLVGGGMLIQSAGVWLATAPTVRPSTRRLTDEEAIRFATAIAEMMELQLAVTGSKDIESPDGAINRNAIGYIYGFIDAALRTIGQDMADMSVGVPITFHVLRRLFPGREARYVEYLSTRIGSDPAVMLGVMRGGQQYLDFNNKTLVAPMGLARAIIEGDDGRVSQGRN